MSKFGTDYKQNTMKRNNQIDEQTQKILRGLEISYKEMVKFKKFKNSPLIIAKDGVIMEIKPKHIKPTTKYVVYTQDIAKHNR